MSEEQATYQCSLSAQELRIGNWVYDGERTQFPMQVVALGKDWAHLDFPGNEGGVWEADSHDIETFFAGLTYLSLQEKGNPMYFIRNGKVNQISIRKPMRGNTVLG